MDTDIYSQRSYKTSRVSFVITDNVEYFTTILLGDAFLAKLLNSIGIDDTSIGIISSVVSFAYLIQLLTVYLQKSIRNVKRLVTVFKTAAMLMFTFTYFLPFLGLGRKTNLLLTYVCVAGGYFIRYFCSTLHFQWGNSFVKPSRLSRFSSTRESISIVLGIILSLGAGMLVDSLEARGELNRAFIIIGVIMAAFSAIDLAMAIITKDNQQLFDEGKKVSGNSFIRQILRNEGYLSALILQNILQFSTYFTVGFLGTYKTQELGYSVMAIQLISTCGHLIRIGVGVPLGKYSDKSSTVNGFLIGLCFTFAGFAALTFASPACRVLMIVYIVLTNISYAGTSVNSANMMLNYVPFSQYSQAVSILRVTCGLVSFAATLLGSALMKLINAGGNTVMGLHVYPQQVMGFVSAVTAAIALLYGFFVVRKQPVISQYGDERAQ